MRAAAFLLACVASVAHGQAMDHGRMQGGSAPSDARDPDAYADGLHAHPMPAMDMHDDARRFALLVDRLEASDGRGTHGQGLDATAWYGGDLDQLWIKVDGGRENGRFASTRTEALWNHVVAPFWSLQTGVRHDLGDGPGRTYAAFGIEGLAPYWFDLEATAYVGEGGRTALRFEGTYDVLFTQRLILQSRVKAEAFGRDDPARHDGAGLSHAVAGLRLRYEVTRKVAPYVGVEFERKFGNTARFAREDGDPASDLRIVAGVRIRL